MREPEPPRSLSSRASKRSNSLIPLVHCCGENPRLLVYGLHMSPTWISIPTPSSRGSIRKLLTNLINTYETQNSISRRIADLLYSRKAVELCCICGYSWEHSYFKCPSCGNNLRDRFKVLIAYNITFRKCLACGHIIGIIEESP